MMGDLFYHTICMLCRPAWYAASCQTVLHADRVPRQGPIIIAANHLSPYDIPCLMAAAGRPLDFVSMIELMGRRWVGAFFARMNALQLNRGRPDVPAVRAIIQRLRAGRAVAIFPEGRIKQPQDSILNGHPINPRLARIGRITGIPIIPCAMLGTARFGRVLAWLPTGQTRYVVAFGQPVSVLDEQIGLAQLRTNLDEAHREATARTGIRLLPARPGNGQVISA